MVAVLVTVGAAKFRSMPAVPVFRVPLVGRLPAAPAVRVSAPTVTEPPGPLKTVVSGATATVKSNAAWAEVDAARAIARATSEKALFSCMFGNLRDRDCHPCVSTGPTVRPILQPRAWCGHGRF